MLFVHIGSKLTPAPVRQDSSFAWKGASQDRPGRVLVGQLGGLLGQERVPVDHRGGDVHELAVRRARLVAQHVECTVSSTEWRSMRIPLARSIVARRPKAPSRSWNSAKRRRTMSMLF